MKWASTISEATHLGEAVAHAGVELLRALGEKPDLVVAFPSGYAASECLKLPKMLAEQLGEGMIFGCSAGGVIGGGREIEQQTALSITAAVLPDVRLGARYLTQQELPDIDDGPGAWETLMGVPANRKAHFLLLADPFSFSPEPLLSGLDQTYPNAVKAGGLASGGETGGGTVLLLGGKAYRNGLVALVLDGNVSVEAIVAQGCRPIGEPMFVTRAKGNILLELDGKRPIDLIHGLHERLEPRDQALFRHSLFVGLTMHDARSQYEQGDFLIRNVLGLDASSGALQIGAALQDNQVLQFHLRDAKTAAYDLERALSRFDRLTDPQPASGALLFSCLGRGKHLYGIPDHDTRAFQRHAGDVPLGGFFCNGEIGPVQGQTYVHGYTSAFALLKPTAD